MIVLSYKPQDELFADNLHEQLAIAFGNSKVVRGIQRLVKLGDDYIDAIQDGINQSDVLLVLMGDIWLGEWLNNPDDPDVIAIQTALQIQKRVIPIFLNDAHMPSVEHLPNDIKPITRRSGLAIHETTFYEDVDSLVDVLKGLTQPLQIQKQHGGMLPPQPYTGVVPQQSFPYAYNFTPLPSSMIYEPGFMAAMMYPTKDREFFSKTLMGVVFTIIPLVGPFLLMGYIIRYGRYILADKPGLPYWDDFSGDLARGFNAIIGLSLLNVVLGTGYFASTYITIVMFEGVNSYYYGSDPLLSLVLLGITAAFAWVACITNISALAAYIATDRFSSMLDFGRHLGACFNIRDGGNLFFSLLIYSIIGGILVGLGYAFLILPGLIISVWLSVGGAMFAAKWAMRRGYPLEVPPDRLPPAAYYVNPYEG